MWHFDQGLKEILENTRSLFYVLSPEDKEELQNQVSLTSYRRNEYVFKEGDKPTGLLIFGAVDDIWINPNQELIVVDYKATGAKEHKIYDSYKRQMEIYQWLLQDNLPLYRDLL